MPLVSGKGRGAFSQNVRTEMAAGKPQKQAVAIAYAEERRMPSRHMGRKTYHAIGNRGK